MDRKKIYYLYVLKTPDDVIFYVGKGKNNRDTSHLSRAHKWNKSGKNKKNVNKKLYNKILSLSNVVVERLIVKLTEKSALKEEAKLIKQIGLENLCNLTYGGEGETRSKETLKIISEKRKKWLKTEEGKKFLETLSIERTGSKNPMYGRKETEEHKKKRMKNVLLKPRWNKGLTKELDDRVSKLAVWKNKTTPNAKSISVKNLMTNEEFSFSSVQKFMNFIKEKFGSINTKKVWKFYYNELKEYKGFIKL